MAITRVELRSDRPRRRRDSRLLRATQFNVDAIKDADTFSASSDLTGPATQGLPKAGTGPTEEELRSEFNLTRSLAQRSASSQSPSEGSSEASARSFNGPLASPTTKRTVTSTGKSAPSVDDSTPLKGPPPSNRPAGEATGSVDSTKGSSEIAERPASAVPSSASKENPESAIVESVLQPSATQSVDATQDSTSEQAQAPDATRSDPKSEPQSAGESRQDLITGEWTLFATTRSQRPNQFAIETTPEAKKMDCPFCAGQEHRTPDPVWVARLDDQLLFDTSEDSTDCQANSSRRAETQSDASKCGCTTDSTDWAVRVVPNLFPAVSCPPRATMSGKSIDHGAHRSRVPLKTLFPHEPASGGHEVIIEAPRHTESLGELNTAEISLVFAAYAQRIRHWQSVPGVRYVSVFKNVGRDAGASLQHSHSQLIATNRVPAVVQQVTRRLQVHYARHGACLQCDLVRGEIEQKSRVISQTDSFVAYCPYASRFPLQVRITSKKHLACFGEMRAPHLAEVSRLVLRIVRWLEALRPKTAYNMLLHTCPVYYQGARDSQHWAMDIFPRMSRLAGFELATGAMINPIFPETAAKAYREKARECDPRYVLR